MLEQQLEQDIKSALLARDSERVSTLRGVKSALLNLKVASGKRETGLSDDEVLKVLAKESKQRQESADLYAQGGDEARERAELSEKAIIDAYLPNRLSEAEISVIIDEVIKSTGINQAQAMGQIIGQVKSKVGASADGAVIAKLVKEKLS
jgi:uncharacterized protein YqeY